MPHIRGEIIIFLNMNQTTNTSSSTKRNINAVELNEGFIIIFQYFAKIKR